MQLAEIANKYLLSLEGMWMLNLWEYSLFELRDILFTVEEMLRMFLIGQMISLCFYLVLKDSTVANLPFRFDGKLLGILANLHSNYSVSVCMLMFASLRYRTFPSFKGYYASWAWEKLQSGYLLFVFYFYGIFYESFLEMAVILDWGSFLFIPQYNNNKCSVSSIVQAILSKYIHKSYYYSVLWQPVFKTIYHTEYKQYWIVPPYDQSFDYFLYFRILTKTLDSIIFIYWISIKLLNFSAYFSEMS